MSTNIAKTFSTWSDFLDYVEELRDFLYDNDYIYHGREKIMQDKDTFFADLKEKGIFEKYLEYWNACKNYIDNNIVVYNFYKDKRFKEFDYSFRFVYQPWAEKYTPYSYAYEKDSVFVWTLLNNRISPNSCYAYSIIHPTIFKLPVNDNFYELGVCWYSKFIYSVEDIENNVITEYTTEDTLKNFIKTVVCTIPTKEGLPKLACVDKELKYDNSCTPGPKSSWVEGISGFKLEKVKEDNSYIVTMGLESREDVMISLFSDTTYFTNQEPQIISNNEMFDTIISAIKTLKIAEDDIASIVWYNKKGKPHIINENGKISIYCYHKGLDEEFHSLKGKLTSKNPYDPAYWGWT